MPSTNIPASDFTPNQAVSLALWLGLASAFALGLGRFAYALLLPPMQDSLGWSYTVAGSLNTANALGYLIGALLAPAAFKRWGAARTLVIACWVGALFLILSSAAHTVILAMLARLGSGLASALSFVAGGLLVARLAAMQPQASGWMLGIYYAGPGAGIVLATGTIPVWLNTLDVQGLQNWQLGWVWLAILSTMIGFALATKVPALAQLEPRIRTTSEAIQGARWQTLRPLRAGLLSYLMFGLGYIGYMTFSLALLKAQGQPPVMVYAFFMILGVGAMLSSRLWAQLLARHRNGWPMAVLNGLLALATLLPAVTEWLPALLFSGLLFGAVFLSVVASTTALVRHNLPTEQWTAGITAFTVIFALGQIVGPTLTGWVSDWQNSLQAGLLVSAAVLALGSAIALRQRAIPRI